eukprot:TRINITY_DN635_c0_g1_i1.p1 TRINITY_DN635_c0_g1~~TRINITY_DN635_c0_g1_i1.p1  ORF type:complete len:276 (+),score=30.08 TRINITY_DN635_c0_g1_i1:117-830(+)
MADNGGDRSPRAQAAGSPRREGSPARSPRRSPGKSPRRNSRSPKRDRSPRRSPRDRSPRRSPVADGSTVYIPGLSRKTTEREIEGYFAKYGKVDNCNLIIDPRENESRGFAFVKMETAKGAEDAIYNINHIEIDGKVVTVEKARRGAAREKTPGRYLGRGRERDTRGGSFRGDRYGGGGYGRDRYEGGGGGRDRYYDRYDPYSRGGGGGRDRSPGYDRRRSRSPYGGGDRRRSRSPY